MLVKMSMWLIYIPKSLQDGRTAYSEGLAKKVQLDDKDRCQRYIFCDSNPCAASEISQVSVARKMLQLTCLAFVRVMTAQGMNRTGCMNWRHS